MSIARLLKRAFIIEVDGKDVSFADPGEDMTPKQVKAFYAATYPHIMNGSIEGPVLNNDKREYRFVTTLGTLG